MSFIFIKDHSMKASFFSLSFDCFGLGFKIKIEEVYEIEED